MMGANLKLDIAILGILACIGLASSVEGCKLTINNNCPFKLAVCTQTTDKPPAQAGPIQQYDLTAGSNKVVNLGDACKFPSGVVYAAPSGKCAVKPGSSSATDDRSKVNLIELNIDPADKEDNYDLSAKDGYAVAQQIKPASAGCATLTCSIPNLGSVCQGVNTIANFPGGSPPKACQNTDGHNPNTHDPTAGTKLFKAACPEAYSYDYDDSSSLKTCPHGTDYNLTFCPAGPTSAESAVSVT